MHAPKVDPALGGASIKVFGTPVLDPKAQERALSGQSPALALAEGGVDRGARANHRRRRIRRAVAKGDFGGETTALANYLVPAFYGDPTVF